MIIKGDMEMKYKSNAQTIVIDFDDTLCEFVRPALDRVNQKHGWDVRYDDITDWHFSTFPEEVRKAIYHEFSRPELYESQTPIPGSGEMLRHLIDAGHDVIITSSAYPEYMTTRATQIMTLFPMVSQENILLGTRKDTVQADIMLDDARHNIERTRAKYPILIRRPWNRSMTGLLSVNSFEDFLCLVERIAAQNPQPILRPDNEPSVICLVAPSGAGKSAIARALSKHPAFGIPKSMTTRERRPDEPVDAYRFVSDATFEQHLKAGHFLETTVYSGHKYGTQKEEITRLLDNGQHAVIPIDMCGAASLKAAFGDRAILVFVRRDRAAVIQDIVARRVDDADKVRRIMSLDAEYANEDLCDFTLVNNSTLQDAVHRITAYLKTA